MVLERNIERTLDILRSNKGYISGQDISEKLSISRTTVWKYINLLKDRGYRIDSVTNKGYKLVSSPDRLDYNELGVYLNTSYIGRKVIYYDSIESTNKEGKKIAVKSDEGLVIIGEEQTQGRGRMGRGWVSPKGKGVWMTLVLKPKINPLDSRKISLIASAAVVKAMENLGIEGQLKWPNDILINRKKIAGILTEINCEIDLVNYILVGIGINVNLDKEDFPKDLQEKASSIKIELGKKISRQKLVANILNEFEVLYDEFIEENNIKKSIEINREKLVFLGENIRVIENGKEKISRAKALDDNGLLVIENQDQSIEKLFSGEISIRGIKGYI